MVSKFSQSAVQYNLEVEQVQDQGILLNIVRASKRRPMVFPTITSVTGTQLPGQQLGFTIPLTGDDKNVFSPTFSTPSGPSVGLGVVETQEFYRGLLKPLDMDTIDLYVHRGLPRVLLFQLAFSRIDVTQPGPMDSSPPKRTTFFNYVGTNESFDRFDKFLRALVRAGLTTEKTDETSPVGPLMTAAEIKHQDNFVSETATAGLSIKQIDWCKFSADERAPALAQANAKATSKDLETLCAKKKDDQALFSATLLPAIYRVEKSGGGHGLCFAGDKMGGACDHTKKDKAKKDAANTVGGLAMLSQTASNSNGTCQAVQAAGADIICGDDAKPFEISFTVRSTYGVIYYLGEIVRRAHDPDHPSAEPPRLICANTRNMPGADQEEPVFLLVDPGKAGPSTCARGGSSSAITVIPGGFLSVRYDGKTYAVPSNDQAGETYLALDLVTELIALNRQAKDVPTTNLITAVGR